MKRRECDECGETVVIPGPNETVTKGETPVAHILRTGHSLKAEPQLTGCHHCGNAWLYTGAEDRATCPNCRRKVSAGELPDEVGAAYAKAAER